MKIADSLLLNQCHVLSTKEDEKEEKHNDMYFQKAHMLNIYIMYTTKITTP